MASPASAKFGIAPGFSATMHDASGDDVTQAGAHPNATVHFMLRTALDADGKTVPDESLKDVTVELPRGVIGNPMATPRCRHQEFKAMRCGPESIVGVETLHFAPIPGVPRPIDAAVPVYNLVPPEGVAARFAFQVTSVVVMIDARVRSDGDYHLVTDLRDISTALQVYGSTLTLWGVPADMNGPGPLRFYGGSLTYGGPGSGPRRAFLSNPTECGAPPVTRIRVRSWQNPLRSTGALFEAADGVDGCERLSFSPSLDLRPESPRAGVGSPYGVTIEVPQSDDPDGLATPAVRDVSVTLPKGVAVSPSSAHGLVGCTDAQAALGSLAQPACPAASKIGTVSIETPLLEGPLTGAIHLGQPKSMDAQTGEMLRTLLIASGYGVTVKLEGKITPDPVTGRLRAVFADNPQLPFSKLRLRFQGGDRAPLTNPQTCGTHTTSATITSWGGQSVTSDSSFEITQDANGDPCAPLGFAPSFSAGTASAQAGAFTPFTLTFGRDDAQQDLGDLTVQLPPGFTGMLASAELCAEAQAAAGTCGEASRIGSASVTAGAGASPYQLSGRVYITGPYRGAPFGMSIVVPAQAGPFDLGTVVVRAAIAVDRTTAALRVTSDPMPTILQGIPLRVRTVSIAIDRPGFMLNPTSCSEKRVEATIRSAQGAAASVGSRFQVGGCRALPFKPKLGLRIGARGRTRGGITTPFAARLTTRPGDGNLRAVTVKLPRTLNARLNVVNDACTLEQFRAGECTKRVGTGTAVTPLLRAPLSGPAYFVRNPERRIPDLMVALRGEVEIDLTGRVTIPRDLTIKTAFDTIPDVPITSFALRLVAGRRGPLSTIPNMCTVRSRRASLATVDYRAQSGRLIRRRQRIAVDGCPKATAKGKRDAKAKGKRDANAKGRRDAKAKGRRDAKGR
nr:hypothetical protein [Conexibacter arvalis]